jgi:hypothetical protein
MRLYSLHSGDWLAPLSLFMDANLSVEKAPDGDGRLRLDPLCHLLDALVAMRWDLKTRVHDGLELPEAVTVRLQGVDDDLDDVILALKSFLREQGQPL